MRRKRSRLIKHFELDSPFKIGIEDDDGSFFPRDIPEPEIALVPRAEPHVEITDLYEKPKDWYFIPELIEEFANQAYTAYYQGLYFASFMCSIGCLELTLKYEYVRKTKDHTKFESHRFTFNEMIQKSAEIGLKKYSRKLKICGEGRDGLFHFNPIKLSNALKKIQKELFKPGTKITVACLDEDKIEEYPFEAFPWSISNYVDNVNWSKAAFYVYSVMYDITRDFYGEDRVAKYLQESIDDYHRIEKRKKRGIN